MGLATHEELHGATTKEYQHEPSRWLNLDVNRHDATHIFDNFRRDQESCHASNLPTNGKSEDRRESTESLIRHPATLSQPRHDLESGLRRNRNTFPIILCGILSLLIIALSIRFVMLNLGNCATHMSSKTTATAIFFAS